MARAATTSTEMTLNALRAYWRRNNAFSRLSVSAIRAGGARLTAQSVESQRCFGEQLATEVGSAQSAMGSTVDNLKSA